MRFSTVLPFAVLAITGVSASMDSPVNPLAHIAKRQLSSPQACVDKCQAVNNKASACATAADVKCVCNKDVINGLVDCAKCGIAADASLKPTMQQYLDAVAQGCKAAGADVGTISLEGASAKNSGSTLTASAIGVAAGVSALFAGLL